MPNLSLNGTAFFGAPKNGGTTIRMWLKHYEGTLPDFSGATGYYSLRGHRMPRLWHDNLIHEPRFFQAAEPGALAWCVKRDPVARFVSAYTDKVLNERLVAWPVDRCLAMLETGEMDRIARGTGPDSLAACHFLPQCVWLGPDRSYYDRVFDIAEMKSVKQFCEEVVFRVRLPDLHARNLAASATARVILTPDEERRAASVYRADFEAGWH